ncbi:uncharacterized protein BO97DRAFT_195524 [Aspergillus homomorphus CBS 101889]|uniref:F-box domain-containing protein n=1 Tax=Aspergillus homomorphus (strain CBS 101889) TaxID=1450537 RepID=A0A395HMY8_ASPHC|nr:hypothetical protein BO97DRAFT_195524 [Aspergillus homomorphus CBS 101889]RAL08783.1 hypothetical protein BO97DRAFT_195524 [Aspergillus homomorphus CBS 101889]
MSAEQELRGINSLPMELCDEIVLLVATESLSLCSCDVDGHDYYSFKERNKRLRRPRLVNKLFHQSATRILFKDTIMCYEGPLRDDINQTETKLQGIIASGLTRYIQNLHVDPKLLCRSFHLLFQNLHCLQGFFCNVSTPRDDERDFIFTALQHAHPPSLRTLRLRGYGLGHHPSFERMLVIFLPQLQDLSVELRGKTKEPKDTIFCLGEQIFRHAQRLRSLVIKWYDFEVPGYHSFLPLDAPLERLHLTRVVISYELLSAVLSYRETLFYLRFRGVTLRTGSWAQFLTSLRRFPKLVDLMVLGCRYEPSAAHNDFEEISRFSTLRPDDISAYEACLAEVKARQKETGYKEPWTTSWSDLDPGRHWTRLAIRLDSQNTGLSE